MFWALEQASYLHIVEALRLFQLSITHTNLSVEARCQAGVFHKFLDAYESE